MDKKELFKKYWFVGLVAIVLLVFIIFDPVEKQTAKSYTWNVARC